MSAPNAPRYLDLAFTTCDGACCKGTQKAYRFPGKLVLWSLFRLFALFLGSRSCKIDTCKETKRQQERLGVFCEALQYKPDGLVRQSVKSHALLRSDPGQHTVHEFTMTTAGVILVMILWGRSRKDRASRAKGELLFAAWLEGCVPSQACAQAVVTAVLGPAGALCNKGVSEGRCKHLAVALDYLGLGDSPQKAVLLRIAPGMP